MFARLARFACFATLMMFGPLVTAADVPPTFRLGDAATPHQYSVRLTIDPSTERFQGEVAIELAINRDTETLWLNGSGLEVASASWAAEGKAVALAAVDGGTQFVGFRAAEPLRAGSGVLTVRYRGKIDSLATRGIFRQQEQGDWYVATQFEALSARRAFPCFDEPAWKTPWQLTLEVPATQLAFSNTPVAAEVPAPGGMKRVTFARTQALPSYLIAFGVGPYDVVDGGVAGRNRTVLRYLVPRGRGAETRYAQQVTPRLLEILEEYFGTPYPFEKLDSLVIPQTVNFGAMENPGLITYVSTRMLAKPDQESHAFRRGYAGTAAHEIAHMWFGDLVTMAWWDDTWLNESFATWAGNKALRRLEPTWDDGYDRAEARRRAMRLDRLSVARRVRSAVANAGDVGAAFDAISYQKGGQVLGMFEQVLGEERFRDGVRRYLARHARSNATSADFMAALAEAAGQGSTLPEQFSSFINQPGVPLIKLSLECKGAPALILEQQRLRPLGSKAAAEPRWSTPACFRYSVKGRVGEACTAVTNGTSRFVLPAATACPDWVVGNVDGRGYYLALADESLQKRLLPHALKLPAADAVTMLGDAGLLVDSGLMPVAHALALAEKLVRHESVVVRLAVTELLVAIHADWLGPLDKRRLQQLLKLQLAPQARALGWREKPAEDIRLRNLRQVLLPLVADQGADPALRREATELASRWLLARDAIAAGMVEPLINFSAAIADRTHFERLMQAALEESGSADRSRLLKALMLVRDPALRETAFGLVLDRRVGGRDALAMLQGALGDEHNRLWAFAFLRKNYDAIVARLPGESTGNLISALSGACTEGQRDAFALFFGERSKRISGGALRYLQTLESMEICVAARTAPSLARGIAQVSPARR